MYGKSNTITSLRSGHAPENLRVKGMSKRGRPKAVTENWDCQIHLRLHVGEDDDLIGFLSAIPMGRRALALKAALRSGGLQTAGFADESLDDELAAAADEFLK